MCVKVTQSDPRARSSAPIVEPNCGVSLCPNTSMWWHSQPLRNSSGRSQVAFSAKPAEQPILDATGMWCVTAQRWQRSHSAQQRGGIPSRLTTVQGKAKLLSAPSPLGSPNQTLNEGKTAQKSENSAGTACRPMHPEAKLVSKTHGGA